MSPRVPCVVQVYIVYPYCKAYTLHISIMCHAVNGKWQLVSSSGLDGYLKACGK